MKRIKKPLPFCWINNKSYTSLTPKYRQAIFILFSLLVSSNIFGQTACNCSKVLEEIQLITSENYAGFEYNKKLYGDNKYKKLCRKLKKKAKRINSDSLCEKELIKYANFFNDKHFNIITDDLAHQLEASNQAPEFKLFKNGKVSYIKLPSFDLEFKTVIDSLVKLSHQQIMNSSLFIIDVSHNEGGGDECYDPLVPYFYTNPIQKEGIDLKSSKGNIAELESYLNYTDYFDKESLDALRGWIEKGKGNEGSFVNVTPEQTLTLDTVFEGPKIALIITEAKSAAEGIILDAIQSEKVTTFGENSGGVRDFLNVRHQKLESCDITLGLPMTKSTRVPEQAIDGVGIEPDVFLKVDDLEKMINAIVNHFNIK